MNSCGHRSCHKTQSSGIQSPNNSVTPCVATQLPQDVFFLAARHKSHLRFHSAFLYQSPKRQNPANPHSFPLRNTSKEDLTSLYGLCVPPGQAVTLVHRSCLPGKPFHHQRQRVRTLHQGGVCKASSPYRILSYQDKESERRKSMRSKGKNT